MKMTQQMLMRELYNLLKSRFKKLLITIKILKRNQVPQNN